MKKHLLHQDVAGTSHKLMIHLIGCGGTGSHVLTNLGMINQALIQIGRQAMFVRAFDFDHISETNVGRQNFAPADIGKNKATVLIERINRFYGTQWEAEGSDYLMFNAGYDGEPDIVISCVDSIQSRESVQKMTIGRRRAKYWMDIGNQARSAQIILGAYNEKKNTKTLSRNLPDFFQEFPGIKDDPNDNTPSCSALEALNRQDLFINKLVATFATNMLWQLLKDFQIHYRGLYINLESMQINKIPL